jgi:hypothetical protein
MERLPLELWTVILEKVAQDHFDAIALARVCKGFLRISHQLRGGFSFSSKYYSLEQIHAYLVRFGLLPCVRFLKIADEANDVGTVEEIAALLPKLYALREITFALSDNTFPIYRSLLFLPVTSLGMSIVRPLGDRIPEFITIWSQLTGLRSISLHITDSSGFECLVPFLHSSLEEICLYRDSPLRTRLDYESPLIPALTALPRLTSLRLAPFVLSDPHHLISRITSLRSLDVCCAHFARYVCSLTGLQALTMICSWRAPPASFSRLSSLRELNLTMRTLPDWDRHDIDNTYARILSALPHLESFVCRPNYFSDMLYVLPTRLTHLDISDQISGQQSWQRFPYLLSLSAAGDDLRSLADAPVAMRLTSLTYRSTKPPAHVAWSSFVALNKLVMALPGDTSPLSVLTALSCLKLYAIQEPDLRFLSTLTRLRKLLLDFEPELLDTQAQWDVLSCLTRLQKLSLSGVSFQSPPAQFFELLKNAPQMRAPVISGNRRYLKNHSGVSNVSDNTE